jgi:hypothetical protein
MIQESVLVVGVEVGNHERHLFDVSSLDVMYGQLLRQLLGITSTSTWAMAASHYQAAVKPQQVTGTGLHSVQIRC